MASRTVPETNPAGQESILPAKDELEATFGKFLVDKQPDTQGEAPDSTTTEQSMRLENVRAVTPLAALHVSKEQRSYPNLESWLVRAAWLWLIGSVCWFVLVAGRIWRFHRLLRFAQPAPPLLQQEAQALAHKLDLDRPPQLWLMPGSIAPLVWATGGRARLYFPVNLLEYLDPQERAALLLHELAHVRRRDHWIRWLELLATGLYWWYPLVWWACRRLQAAEEDCCDAWVVGELRGTEKTYASALLDTVDFLSETRPALPPLASGMARFHDLERRLAMIMRGGTPKHLSRTGQVGLLGCAVFLLPLTPIPGEPPKPAANPSATTLARPLRTVNKPVLPEEPVRFETKSFNLQQADAGAIWAIVYSPDGKRLATASGGNGDRPGELTVWNAATRDEIYTIHEPDSVRSVAFSPDNKFIATGSFDKTAKLRDAATGKLLVDLRGHRGAVNSVAFSPDGKLLATGSLDSTIKLWEVPSGKLQKTLGSEADLGNMTLGRLVSTVKNQLSASGHTDWVLSVAFSPDGKTLASASRDQTAKLWDVATGKEKLTLRGHTNWVECVRFTPDGQTVLTASWDFTIKKWDVATGRGQGTLLAHDGYALSMAFTRDGKIMATGGSDATVKLWDVPTLAEISALPLNPGSVYGVAFSPDGKTLATGSWDKTARLWDVSTGQELAKLQRKDYVPENTPALLAAAYSPDGKLLAVG
ncbi:MAG TPA: M56 family metallopeptidase, partial [Gemmataceae bacterium]|nr:M56 family metallopeptidase [Gemmataceae bacterium]